MSFSQAKIISQLRHVGLRPTRHRVGLALLLFDREATRHVTAEQLYTEAHVANIRLSLATVYNILHQFTAAGLVREVSLGPGQRHFDSNTAPHHHIINSNTGAVTCVHADMVGFSCLPKVPDGEAIDRIEVILWTRDRTEFNT